MQNQSNASANAFNLVPMGAQQFYHMAQHHAMVNTPFAPMMPGYLPLPEPDAYSSMVALGGYNLPQNMVHPHAAIDASYLDSANAWAYGFPQTSAHSTTSVPTTSDAFLLSTPLDAVLNNRAYPSSSVNGSSSGIHAAPGISPLYGPREAFPGIPDEPSPAEHISDAPFADEHKWRKYGQKQVKRSPYPRNYYKCTVAGCPAKKHLEKFWDTSANRERCRTIYLGEHVHPVAASPQVFASNQQDFQNNVLAQSAKIRVIGTANDSVDLAAQQRLVVECGSQVDENEDGYYWRKYGQKSVKGSSTPRQYYRCRVVNCPVKKTVEASPKGNTIVTYDGCHSHEPGYHTPDASVPTSPALQRTVSPAPHMQQQQMMMPLQQQNASALPSLRILVKLEHPESHQHNIGYPAVESPSSSSFSTTDDEESYLSEPSPKRTFTDEDVSYDDQIHHFAPDAPPAEAWYSLWESNPDLITH